MKYNLFLNFISLTFVYSCNQNSVEEVTIPEDNQNQTAIEKPIYDDVQNYECNRIIISYYDNTTPINPSYKHYGPFSTAVIYETTSNLVIDGFEQMTSEAEKTGYCCCPEYNYTISFYDGTKDFKKYYVDTLEFENKVRIFEQNYQYSFIIEKKIWEKYLSEFEIISFSEYSIHDLSYARKIYCYTLENDLPIITCNRASKEWMNFDGDFKIKVATVGEKLEESIVYSKIRDAYPTDTFKIETISHYQRCGSYDGHDCYEELILQIFCNKDFYDKFNIYSPKSFFDKAFAEFYVLGTKEELSKVDQIEKESE